MKSIIKPFSDYGHQRRLIEGMSGHELPRRVTFVVGPNGAGKSTLLTSLRSSLALSGTCLGKSQWIYDPHWSRKTPMRLLGLEGNSQPVLTNAPGYLDLQALGWRGETTWLHDGRSTHDVRTWMMAGRNRDFERSLGQASTKGSHGEARRFELQAMFAWARGSLALESNIDQDLEDAWLEGEKPSDARWLLLDEPENGLEAPAVKSLFASLIELGTDPDGPVSRVLIATHSPYALAWRDHSDVGFLTLGDEDWLAAMDPSERNPGSVLSRFDHLPSAKPSQAQHRSAPESSAPL